MAPRTLLAGLFVAVTLSIVAPPQPAAQTVDPDPGRFAADIEAFRQWDEKNATPDDGVLFVGSSTIRLWPTAVRFPGRPVINRGFGGSHISDVNHFVDDVALKYRPATVVFYAGDNDINDGKTPNRVVADFRTFVDRVLAVRPDARIFFLAIKPSPARWSMWPAMRRANELVLAYARPHPQLVFVDVASPMLTAEGQPRPHLYVADGLHLSEAGYDLWTGIVAREIDAAAAPH